ncbi:uncharacterized protein DUF4386 [Isoptericola jiangsuensis]|uniref:Uncharacterized protein DUF4386 n=1 Tax=Isoptericola jiangsuensis TaxID=548579 RepID=A0A2A9EXG6_9MICO|nr:DUF4386 domain-containing protein [Isoptericola jiangsuensis]PFG43734.1 uncharacterized protein DUF4386 [Isoptericola jiangsuensis]
MHPLVARPLARTTGLLYLALAVTGMLGFLVIRPRLVAPGDPDATVANVVAAEQLARGAVALELAVVVAQSLAALWFFRLFRRLDAVNAGAVTAFGLANALAILGSAAALGTAVDSALAGDAASTALMFLLSEHLWGVGGVFFGLWLVPMGLLVLRAGMPRVLGWFLVAGGAGYVLSTFWQVLVPAAPVVGDLLVVPATVGELWMIGALLWYGFRRAPAVAAPEPAEPALQR